MVRPALETSGLTTKLILSYVSDQGGPGAVAATLRHAGVPHAQHELEDAQRWFTYRDKIALFDGAALALDDPEVAGRVGSSALSTNVLASLVPLFRAFGGPAPLLRQVALAQRRFSSAGDMEAIEVRRSSAVLRYRVLPPNDAHHHDCRYTMGILRQVGPIFGLPDARVDHHGCQVEGASHCTYRVAWMRDLRLRSRRSQRHDAIALEAAGAIEAAEARQATAAALLRLSRSLADLTTVEETAGRLAEATVDAVGCDRASVLLWDRASGGFTTRGLYGFPAELEDDAWRVRVEAGDDGGQPPADGPSCVSRPDASGRLADLMDQFDLGHNVLVPLRSRRHLLGVMNASWTTDSPAPDFEELGERLAGLADQASTALENARLLETVRRQALHDGLTGLANQRLFADRVRQGLARARRTGEELALAVLDLDRFKTVNDSLGHAVGDELLVEVGRRLSTCIREVDSVARMGGDEFTLLLPGADGAQAAAQTASRVLAAFERPFDVGGHLLRVTPSIGFAIHPGHGDELDDLLKRADAAMYQAKAAGRNTWAVYTSGMSEQAYGRLTLEADLSRAVAGHELRVAYQPVVRLADGVVIGAEALVRWAHPTLGVLTPDEFVPIAEEIGIVADIDGWVLRRACLDLGRAQVASGEPVCISVNLSGRSLTHPALCERVSEALVAGGILAGQLVLEVTETVTVEEASGVAEVLAELRALGVRVAIDDFGRGHSALSRLDQLPMDQLKIDKAFLDGVTGADDEAPVVTAIIAMGRGLGLEVLAEGVERPEQLAFLRSRGCDLAQGHLFGRPSSGPLSDVLRPCTPVGCARLAGGPALPGRDPVADLG